MGRPLNGRHRARPVTSRRLSATAKAKAGYSIIPGYDDGFAYTAIRSAAFHPNSLGLYDLSGNGVPWEWCGDLRTTTRKSSKSCAAKCLD